MDFKEIISKEIKGYDINKKIIKVKSAKRFVIKLNDISLYSNNYIQTSVMTSKELIATATNSIAIFTNEYIPNHFPSNKYITYLLSVNGKTYEVEPINSNRNGIKIIKVANELNTENNVMYIQEKIKSAILTIQIKTPNNYETPYVSNIKILTGGENNV